MAKENPDNQESLAAAEGVSQSTISRRKAAQGLKDLARNLKAKYDLKLVELVASHGKMESQREALAKKGVEVFERLQVAEEFNIQSVGVGGGSTIRAMVDEIGYGDRPLHITPTTMFMRDTNGHSMDAAFNAMALFLKCGRTAKSSICALPPFGAVDPAVKPLAERNRGLKNVYENACKADLLLMGIGAFDKSSPLAGVFREHGASQEQLTELRAVAEFNLALLNAAGHDLTEKACGHEERITQYSGWEASHPIFPALGLQKIKGIARGPHTFVLGIAGGKQKWKAIRAVLKAKMISGLITDVECAKHLFAEPKLDSDK